MTQTKQKQHPVTRMLFLKFDEILNLGRCCVGGVLGFAGGRKETELVFVLLRGSAGLAAGLFNRSFVGAQTTNFVEFAFYFHFAFQALERTINGFAFFNWDFEHLDSGVMMVICDWGRAVCLVTSFVEVTNSLPAEFGKGSEI
jgi:hypothetical protein